jgi:uroporphyrinogen-III decarboxylase
MTGREKIEAALSKEGTAQIPTVICYVDIFIRDHWEALTQAPWWYPKEPDLERQMKWRRDVQEKTGLDWYEIPIDYNYTQEDRNHIVIEEQGGGIYRIDRRTGQKEALIRPHWSDIEFGASSNPERPPETEADIDLVFGQFDENRSGMEAEDGRSALSLVMLEELGRRQFPVAQLTPPLFSTFYQWGYESIMILIATRPELVAHACDRFFERCVQDLQETARLGAKGIWIEDNLSDQISPAHFKSLNLDYIIKLIDEIRSLGLKSIYYYCGDPTGKWDFITGIGADAFAFEESKKGFTIDIEDVVDRVNGRAAVFGNLDAIHTLPYASEDRLRHEIKRQIAAGRKNNNRFVMSIGSPVTPDTPVERVRLYVDLVHELGEV